MYRSCILCGCVVWLGRVIPNKLWLIITRSSPVEIACGLVRLCFTISVTYSSTVLAFCLLALSLSLSVSVSHSPPSFSLCLSVSVCVCVSLSLSLSLCSLFGGGGGGGDRKKERRKKRTTLPF